MYSPSTMSMGDQGGMRARSQVGTTGTYPPQMDVIYQPNRATSEGHRNIPSLEMTSTGLESHVLGEHEIVPESVASGWSNGPQKKHKQSMFSRLTLRGSHDNKNTDIGTFAHLTHTSLTSNTDYTTASGRSEGSSSDNEVMMTTTITSTPSTGTFAGEEPNPWAEPSVEPKGNVERLDPPMPTRTNGSLQPTSTQAPVRRMTEPSKMNSYGGFCKGAFEVQAGISSMKRRQEMGPLTSNPYFWACPSSKCAFSGIAYRHGNDWVWDTRIRTSHGVRYRWSFLAKSHVQQGRVKHETYNYKCVFCVLQNLKTPVIQKDADLMEHISQHRGEHFGEAILHRTLCINDRLATEADEFDINLVPPDDNTDKLRLEHQHNSNMTEDPVSTRIAYSPNDYG